MALLERIAQELRIPLPAEGREPELAAPTDIREVVSALDTVLPVDSCQTVPNTQEGSLDDDLGYELDRPVSDRPNRAVQDGA